MVLFQFPLRIEVRIKALIVVKMASAAVPESLPS